MKNVKTAVRFLGCCQICEKEHKLHAGLLVHHGYTRPGYGAIVGDCYGVSELPYERSCELVKEYRVMVQDDVAAAEKYLSALEAGKVTSITVKNWRRETVQYAVGVTPFYEWKSAVESRISDTKYRLRLLGKEVERLTKRIDAWKLSPVGERTEEVRAAEKKAEADARKAARDAARKAKEEKAAALKAKRETLEATRKAVREGFFSKFRALAETLSADPSQEKAAKDAALLLAHEMKKKKNAAAVSFYDYKEIDAALLVLGLATRDRTDSRWVSYRYPLV